MSKFSHPLPISILILCLVGCSSHTHVGDGMGTASPDGRFTLAVGVDGAARRAYIDKTKKTIGIWIGSTNAANPTTFFEHSYTLVGSDVAWETQWSSADVVSVKFYDWGDGVSNYNNMNHLTTSNHIAIFSFVLDKSTEKFVEKK